jgi:purine nucleoside phosphorylase
MTNYAAGLGGDTLGHEQTLAVAREASGKVCRVLRAFIERY